MSALLSNPALLVGLIRAVLILLVTFGVAVTGPSRTASSSSWAQRSPS
jgi:hypothetical protein